MHIELLLGKSGNSHRYRLSRRLLLATVSVSGASREATPACCTQTPKDGGRVPAQRPQGWIHPKRHPGNAVGPQ